MATKQIEDERIRWRRATNGAATGDAVVYWMQQAQRARTNPALEFAIQQANERNLPARVVFCVVADYPEAASRHFDFMFEGLVEVEGDLARRGIRFDAVVGHPASVFASMGDEMALLVLDRGYLPIQRSWRDDVEGVVDCPVAEIETDAVVPVDLVSDRAEVAARTIRPKILCHLDRFVVDLATTPLSRPSVAGNRSARGPVGCVPDHERLDLADIGAAIDRLPIAAEPGPVDGLRAGTRAAHRALDEFIDSVLPDYPSRRNRYDRDDSSSRLSPYLHFGQVSPVEIARRVRASGAPSESIEAFVDEVVIRRELAFNHAGTADHGRYAGLPDWAKTTLADHADDEREVVLTATQLEAGETPDELWNAIMAQIREHGWVHNQLRMYWGKQVVRWTNTPGHAFRTLLELNNRYFLDGRDPNSYANVAWCFGLHDQGFAERDIIGKVRPFTDQALRRKGDLDGWLAEHPAAG